MRNVGHKTHLALQNWFVIKNQFVLALTAHSYPHLVLARAEMNLGGFAHRGRYRRAHACSGRRKWQRIEAAGSTAPRNGTSSAVPPIRIGHSPKNWFYTSLINFKVKQLLHSTRKSHLNSCVEPFAWAHGGLWGWQESRSNLWCMGGTETPCHQ